MSQEIAGALHELAREFYRGELPLAEYRLKRRNLLTLLFDKETNSATRPQAGEQRRQPDVEPDTSTVPPQPPVDNGMAAVSKPPVDNGMAAVSKPPVDNGMVAVSKPQTAAAVAPATGKGKRRILLPIVAIGLAVVAALGILFLITGKEVTTPSATKIIIDQPPDAVARGLIEDFLDQNIWDDRRLDELRLRWRGLTPDQRAEAQGTQWLIRFQREVEDLIDEQRAIGPLTGDEPALSLARAMGLAVQFESTAQPEPEQAAIATVKSPAAEQAPITTVKSPAPVRSGPAPDNVTVVDLEPTEQSQEMTVSPAADPSTAAAVTTAAAIERVTPDRGQSAVGSSTPDETSSVTQNTPVAARETDKPVCHAGLLRTRSPTCQDTLPNGNKGPRLVVIPAGEFRMGSKWLANEQPVHTVRLTRPLAVGQFEVSHAEYTLFCAATGRDCPASPWGRGQFPAVNVSWNDATAYLQWLSDQTGRQYRLPTEAEWEYAARAGSETRYPRGEELAIADVRYGADAPMANDVRRINSNGFRLYHTVGNVREWVQDNWIDDYAGAPGAADQARLVSATADRVARGGCYDDNDQAVRSASRLPLPATTRDTCTGFRVMRELDL